jgi:RNA polymerase sigma-70 factor (ECF subfamily)
MLEDDFKTIIILRDIKGFTYDEISEILACNLGTVKSRLSRGRKRLKELLEKEMKANS